MNKAIFIVPIAAILLGATATSVFAQTQPGTCSLNQTDTNSCLNEGNTAGYNVWPYPTRVCVPSSGMNNMNDMQIASYCEGYREGQLQLVQQTINSTYSKGYKDGYGNNTAPAFTGTDFGDFSNLANVPLIGGLIASKSITTGVLHNEQGVFIPWKEICDKGQAYILQSCSTLLGSNGNLTPQGDTAVGCIRNGLAVAAIGQKYNMLGLAQTVLNFAAGPTGCGGIVNLDTIKNAPDFQNILNYLATLIP